MDAIPLIDVTRPYFALRNLSLLPSTAGTSSSGVACTFNREQPSGTQATTFCASEIGRHLAILGSLSAARENPIKSKHYYLALDAYVTMTGITSTHELLIGEAFVTDMDWTRKRVTCKMQALTPDTRQIYAKLEVRYAVLTEAHLLKVVKPVDPPQVYDKVEPWKSSDPSPYQTPICARLIRRPAPDVITAILPLHNTRSMSGHFTPIATAPVAILASNALAVCAQLVKGPIVCENLVAKCKRLATAGEMLELRVGAVRKGDEYDGSMMHLAELFDEGNKSVGKIWFRIKALETGEFQSHL